MLSEVKQATTYQEAVEFLNHLFDLFNENFFKSELSRPTITIQSTPRAYGHFTLSEDTWKSSLGNSHEINIGAGTLSRPIEDVSVTLIHEMTHYWCYQNEIKDTSNCSIYHNHRFKEAAESHGLIVEQEPNRKYGYTKCYPSKDLIHLIHEKGLKDILISRNESWGITIGINGTHDNTGINPPLRTKKGSSHKMVCPECGTIIRATRYDLRIECMDCFAKFEYVD